MSEAVTFPDEVLSLLERPVTATVSTANEDGSPQATVVWFERQGTKLALFAWENAVKVRNMQRDPRVEVLVMDHDRERYPGCPVYVRLIGTAEVKPGDPEMPDRLAIRYGEPEGYLRELGAFVSVYITPTRMTGFGPYPDGSLGGWLEAGG
jgi:PPOX class probable F420-dependent enzyme